MCDSYSTFSDYPIATRSEVALGLSSRVDSSTLFTNLPRYSQYLYKFLATFCACLCQFSTATTAAHQTNLLCDAEATAQHNPLTDHRNAENGEGHVAKAQVRLFRCPIRQPFFNLTLNRFTAATMARARGTELKLTTVKSSQMDMVTNLPLNLDDLHIKLEKIK